MGAIPRTSRSFRLAVLLAICLAACGEGKAQTSVPEGISLPTDLRVHQARGWWPTKGAAAREDFVGTEVCVPCHTSIAASYQATAMSRSAFRAADAEILRHDSHLSFQAGPYIYQLETSEGTSTLKVSDDKASTSDALIWALGMGRMGQTYLYQRGDDFFESHLSFYAASQALDITPGQSRATPVNLETAAGRRMPIDDTQHCFSCHTTASTAKNQFDANSAVPGVTCEGCHGPGANHVAAVKSGMEDVAAGSILNPRQLDRVASVDFCGACHRTWEDVLINRQTRLGVFNVRFAPYRLENSKCWQKGDSRITCVACHDPHKPLARDSASYDSRCLACHLDRPGKKTTADHPGAGCPVAQKDCVSCHMPAVEPPGLHSAFTDHWIRIVAKGAPYPE